VLVGLASSTVEAIYSFSNNGVVQEESNKLENRIKRCHVEQCVGFGDEHD
jgi:hypothetical protein